MINYLAFRDAPSQLRVSITLTNPPFCFFIPQLKQTTFIVQMPGAK